MLPLPNSKTQRNTRQYPLGGFSPSLWAAMLWESPFYSHAICVLVASLLALSCSVAAQSEQTAANGSKPVQTNPALEAANKADAIRILYTGKTMGYFRVPDWQGPSANGSGCKDPAHQRERSAAAAEFDDLLRQELPIDKSKRAILLGTGDNFAPEIEARDFCEPPPGQPGDGKTYQRVNKEMFDWDAKSKTWIRSDAHTDTNATPASGLFMIPMDNVANFFVKEGYAALVPGKQDFYFGAERMREVARFMATQPIPPSVETLHAENGGVQMLGANIIIDTKWKYSHSPLPDSENPPWFIPRFPTAADLLGDGAAADVDIRLSGLTDGAKVYPWFRGVSIDVSGDAGVAKLKPALDAMKFYLCEVDGDNAGNPNAIPKSIKENFCTLLEKQSGQKAGQIRLDFPWTDSRHLYTLHAGANYGLCALPADAKVKAADGSFSFCDRFSVYTPFFQSSSEGSVRPCPDLQDPKCQHDPDPYVLIEARDDNGIPENVAIFGVVDPQIGDSVGMLNFEWSNTASGNFKTVTTVQEPAEALKQLLDSFDRHYEESGLAQDVADGKRRLVKVLLTQMNSQQAQVLGTRLKQFQVVVCAADQEMATVGNVITYEWNAPRGGSVRHPMVLSIPEPYFVASRNPKAVVDIGRMDLRISADAVPKWTIASGHMELFKSSDKLAAKGVSPVFWKAVESALKRDCLPQGFNSRSQSEQIEILTLCEMQKETRADIAVLQQRDFFADLPEDAGDIEARLSDHPDTVLQQLLDRIVWKGDFLKLLNVPGNALQQALRESKAFDAADRSNLSIGANKNRGFISVGITFDSAHGEYLINGLRLDPNKLYSIATSDFIGGGDTGYPDLAAAQIRPAVVPSDFEKQLLTISGIVCRSLAGDQWSAHCIGPIDRDTYLDEIAAKPTNTGPSNTPMEQLRVWSVFHRRRPVPGDPRKVKEKPATLQSLMDQAVEYRPLWDFRLTKASFGITSLGHNGTDAQIDSNFGGITTPGVNSHRFSNWASDFQAQVTRNLRHYQIFASPSYAYNVQFKGQPNASRQINQIANLGMFDLGFARLWNERGSQHRDLVITAHFETPLQETATSFNLKSTPAAVLQFNQPRSYTVLLRSGFRWQRRISSLEFGPEAGHQWDAVKGFQFTTNGRVTATCLAQSAISFSTCVGNSSNPKLTIPPTITANSVVSTLQSGKDHAGMYWKINLTVPLYTRVSYVFTDTGDWFFANFGSENSTDIRFRDISQHQLRFSIFPSLSIGPEVDLLLYENKSLGTLKGTFLRQDQILMKAQFGFDIFNMRKKLDQLEYAPSGKSQ
jgi:hypothetical protein